MEPGPLPDQAPCDDPEKTGAIGGSQSVSRAHVLARILETAIQPFAGIDLEGRITCLNLAFLKLAGASSDDLIGRFLSDFTPEKWRSALARTTARIGATGSSFRFEAECLRLDGYIVPIDVASEPDRDDQGQVVGVFSFVTDLTARKVAEVALRESEDRFRKLYDNAPVGYHEVDAEGVIVGINRTACELLGYSREELLGRPFFDILPPEARVEARQAFAATLKSHTPPRASENAILARDGRQLVVSVEERFKRDDQDQVVGLLVTMQDVTESKQTKAALLAAERRSRALFEGIEDAVFVHALDGRILDANPAAIHLLGYNRDEFLCLTTADIDAPDFAAGYHERLAVQMSAGRQSFLGQHRTKSGKLIPVEIGTTAIQFDEQKAVLAVIRDISERLALEETRRAFAEAEATNAREMAAKNAELTLSEARYRQITESSPDGVVVADFNGAITLFNPASERMFGYEAAEVIGLPLGLLMPKTFGNLGGKPFQDFVKNSRPVLVGNTVELEGRRKKGEDFPLGLSLSAVERDEKIQFIGSFRDQTERQRMRAMLAHTEKLASIGLLSAGVAHEINNPLAYVGNNLAVLERDLASLLQMVALYESSLPLLDDSAPPTAQAVRALSDAFDWPYVKDNLPHMITRTREGIQRIANIVYNLRGLARTSAPKMQPASVRDILQSALEMVRGRLRRNHIEILVEHGDLPQITCVPDQISQVVLNLLINAMQAVESSGRSEGGWVKFQSFTAGDMAALAVSDNGSGIEAESFQLLFDPFYTTKSLGEGTGLGLSICHGIVTGHGGRIEVESQPGAGSTFRVLLPLNPA